MLLALTIVSWVLQAYGWVIIATAIVSWLVVFRVINPYNPTIRAVLRGLAAVTEPVLRPIRRVLPTPGGLDFSSIVVLLVLWLLQLGIDYWRASLIASALAPR